MLRSNILLKFTTITYPFYLVLVIKILLHVLVTYLFQYFELVILQLLLNLFFALQILLNYSLLFVLLTLLVVNPFEN